MDNKRFEVESSKPFSESLIWQLNRDYYQKAGLGAWRYSTVPHHLTSNSMVGRTYAELVFAFLKDLAAKGAVQEKVYILELGAGHGRLAFHVLKHLEVLVSQEGLELPPYCYVLSDIVESNLDFFQSHLQFQSYFEKEVLDVAHFDAIGNKELTLRMSGETIGKNSLTQPLLVIANYFFDSIPNDLFYLEDKKLMACSVALETVQDPHEMEAEELLKNLKPVYQNSLVEAPFYPEPVLNEMLDAYREKLSKTYLFFPKKGIQCIDHLRGLSSKGALLLSMDKGFHEIHDLENAKVPEIITHGSFSVWVNYHAFGAYCEKMGGTALFPSHSTFHLELGCLLFLEDGETYAETMAVYQRVVNDFGPDDFNTLKHHTYQHIAKMDLLDLIAMLRLSAYDSIFFKRLLPRLKQLSSNITFNQRNRLAQTMHKTWDLYFSIYEADDLAYEIGGVFYDLGYFKEALDYFEYSSNQFGQQADVYYNRALCYYQLREDDLFVKTVATAKAQFPNFSKWTQLDNLDLGAA